MRSKLSNPLVLQPSGPRSALPSHAAGTAGTEPNQEARSPCTLALSDHSIHRYAQFGCFASVASIVVSAHPVAPSSGTVLAIGCLLATSVLTWNGQVLEATTPSFVKSCTWTFASSQYRCTSGCCLFNTSSAAVYCSSLSS